MGSGGKGSSKGGAEAVKVVVRCRPINETEVKDKRMVTCSVNQARGEVVLVNPQEPKAEPRKFTFDKTFGPEASTARVQPGYSGFAPALPSRRSGPTARIGAQGASRPWGAPPGVLTPMRARVLATRPERAREGPRRDGAALVGARGPNDRRPPPQPLARDGAPPAPRPGPQSTQQQVFEEVAGAQVEAAMQGFNATIFAYGQTGTGKTYTMEGKGDDPSQQGVIPNSFDKIFATIDADDTGREYLVKVSMLEIYNEEVRDLLGKDPKARLELRDAKKGGVEVPGLGAFVASGPDDMYRFLEIGRKNRAVGATSMNAGSSRSHSVFMVTVASMNTDEKGNDHARVGKLNLVDLAGSERSGKTGAEGDRFKEGIKINLSLTALGNVISALVDGKKHIPYRDSKLTRLLQDSLGGNTKTVMFAMLGPADWNHDETLSTLRYANRAKNIKNKPVVNEDPRDRTIREYQEEIARLRDLLQAFGGDPGGGRKWSALQLCWLRLCFSCCMPPGLPPGRVAPDDGLLAVPQDPDDPHEQTSAEKIRRVQTIQSHFHRSPSKGPPRPGMQDGPGEDGGGDAGGDAGGGASGGAD